MKKRRKPEIGKKLMSSVLAMRMAMELAPVAALTANAAVSEHLVASLAELYDGDTERARQELEALYEAGIIDENGNMVELDIREDGEAVTLEDVTARITAGEEIGDLTVNGHASTQEQLVKINATKQALEIAKMLAEDVEITDEHVANLESLIQGIADGSVDLYAALKSGSLSMKNTNAAPSLSMGTSVLAGSPDAGDDFPSTKTSTGEVSADSDGKYTAPYFSGKDYHPDYSFQLTDPANKTYFTDSNTEGIAADGLIKVTYSGLIRNPEPEEDTGEEDELSGDILTVYLKLNKALTVPVSADVSVLNEIAGVTIDVFTDSGAELTDGRGTITWMPGETTKELTVRVDKENAQAYQGKRAFVVNIGNIQNAQIADYGSQENAPYSNPNAQPPDEVSAWSKTVKLPINDSQNVTKICATYTDREIGKISSDNGGTAIRGNEETHNNMGLQGYRRYFLYQEVDWFPGEWMYPYTFEMEAGLIPISSASALPSMIGLFDASKLDLSNARDVLDRKFSANEPGNGSYLFQCQHSKTVKITSTIMEQIFGSGQSSDGNRFLLAGCVDAKDNDPGSVTSITVKTKAPAEYNEIRDVSVPAGTYYSGQVIPITVSMKAYAMGTENTKLMVNGIECPLLDSAGTESTQFTFGYTVREEEAVTLNVTRLTGLQNAMGQTVKYENEYAGKTIGKDNDVFIVSAIKQASLDMANVEYGISDDVSGQVVTVLIPFKQDAKKEWVANEAEECTTDGMPVSLPIPGDENATAGNYLRGAYFSYDNGKTRYPVYVVNAGGEEGVALAARFAAPANVSSYLRKDTVNLFMDTVNIGIEDAAKYLDTWENAKFDTKGYAYFDGTDKEAASLIAGAVYSYYVKNSIQFDQTAYTSRGDIDYTSRTENGFLHLDDGNHVFLQDAANPQNQYDVEIVANDALYQSIVNGARAEDRKDLTLSWQTSGRKAFTFVDPQYFTWQSSDESIAKIETDEDGVGHVTLTGVSGEVSFSLTVGNGSEENAYTLSLGALTVLEGKTPFLNISEFSRIRQTLTYTDIDVAFASNVTARNAQSDKTVVTKFIATLYKAAPVTGTDNQYTRTGEPIWTGEFESTVDDALTHITVPGDQLTDAGAYEVVITTQYNGALVSGKLVNAEELTAKANIVAKQAPAWIKLNKLDSYYVTAGEIPAIGYTTSDKVTEVEYTIQKTGEAVSARKQASGGVITFAPATPNSLKEAYTITVYARNTATDDWSVDSMLLTVYNPQILHQIVADVTSGQIGGTTGGTGDAVDNTIVNMDNHSKLSSYGVTGSNYKLNYEDFTALRTDMSLQKIVSVNYGEAVYGLLSDKMQWESSDSSKVSINYKQGGIYSDINDYSYTSYTPATDLLLVGKAETGDERITITATHANTGISSSFDVTANTLKDQLYVFQFNPAAQTTVIYTNGKGDKRRLESNANGELAVYEPEGITGKVMAMSRKDGATYSKTFDADTLETGERDISALQLYPCNNIHMEEVSRVNLTIQKPDGTPYNGQITIRGGVYKNGTYCPDALISVNDAAIMKNGREDITATVTDGKLQLQLDPEQFKYNLNDPNEYGAQPDDKITYVFEYRTGDTYLPGYVMLNAAGGSSKRTDSLVRLKKNPTGKNTPQIINQSLQLYFDGKPMEQRSDVTNYTDNIGISKRFNKGILYTDVVLLGEPVTTDENGYSVYGGNSVTSFALYTTNNKQLTGQTCNTKSTADQILHLSDMDNSSLFVFPFSSLPSARSSYTITDANLKQDGITDEGSNPTPTSRVKAMLVRDGVTVYTETLPFGLSNLSHQKDLSAADGGVKELGEEIDKELKSKLDMGSIFGDIDVNDMLKKGFVFLSKMQALSGENPINMMILPTADPSRFRIIASIGYDKREMKTDTNPSVDFDPDHLAEDTAEFQKEMKEMMEEEKKKGKKKDKKDEADAGKVSYNINFYGTVILEAQIGGLGKKWDIDFCGGNVGTNFEIKYEWGQNFMCGPVPATISFEIKATADMEVAFANKADARAMLIDAAVGISIEAFAGLGFDVSLFALKLGIFGEISANDNFLYLTQGNQTGNKLEIAGEIGIRLEVKVVLVKYKKTFASTGFNWSKTWGKYDQIQETWENEGYVDLFGTTKKGKPYTMHLTSNGVAMVEIDGGGEIENRDYLKLAPMLRNAPKPFGAASDGMALLQENAYPYSNPVLTDDGSIMLFISDNNNSDEPQSVVSYAVKNGDSYDIKGAVDTSEGNILADTDVVASGTGSNAFAAWVKQMDSPEKEMHDETTYDDLGMMLNATEIYGGSYVGGQWTVKRLTENTDADMAPTIASSGNRAIVAWRSLSATAMPEEGGTDDFTAMFNAENSIRYRIFDGTEWKEAQIAYNGSAGTVNAIDSAVLSDGTSLLVYSVRTTDDLTGSETFYTLIDPNGNVVTTGRLTNNEYTDTNAQVTTVGDQFIVGWYSEYASDAADGTMSHDIGLARINANGSVDASFPESLGATASASIGSDFRFSSPAGNDDLSKLSIVWSQQKESDAAEDSGKHQLNAIRFYEDNGEIGVTAPTTIAETTKNYTVDHFDTYTDTNDEIKVVLVGSDYNNIEGMDVYDTIDLTDLPIEAVNDASETADQLAILEKEPTASMRLASGAFPKSAIEANADMDLDNTIPGLDMPVQFTVTNTGTSTISSVTSKIGTQTDVIDGLNLLPGQSTVLTVSYHVPETISDVTYTLTTNGAATATGTLTLNRPDVGISSMTVTREGNKTRDIQLILSNASNIPLAGSGKNVKLAFFKDGKHTEQIGETVTVAAADYQNIDDGLYVYNYKNLKVEDFIGDALEVPEDGVRIYASAWVEDTDELYTMNNDANVTFGGLLAKYKSQTTMDTALVADDEGNYTVNADITNNSLQNADLGSITADILDSDGAVLTSVVLTEDDLTLTGEQNVKLTKALPDITGEPVSVSLRSSEKSVTLDAQTNGGSSDILSLTLTTDNKPAGTLPEATKEGFYVFDGWFTKPKGGEQITEDTVLEGGSTVYAQFTYNTAQIVMDQIDALPDVDDIVAADEEAIKAAREAYEALSPAQSAKITEESLNKLAAAEKAVADRIAADEVIEKINEIGKVALTDTSKELIDAAREAYESLTDDQKALVGNIDNLTADEETYSELQVDDVKTKINDIGDVELTTASKNAITEARAAYEALSAEQQHLVPNAMVLTYAEKLYNALETAEKAEADKTAAEKAQFDAEKAAEEAEKKAAAAEAAKKAAEEAQAAAEEALAKTEGEAAEKVAAAEAAKKAAEKAQAAAEEALAKTEGDAAEKVAAAEAAKKAAEEAQAAAEEALAKTEGDAAEKVAAAEAAKKAAEEAQAAAEEALAKTEGEAAEKVAAAEVAKKAAEEAQAAAEEALAKTEGDAAEKVAAASAAKKAAEEAQAAAEQAAQKAEEKAAAAETAQKTAEDALEKVESDAAERIAVAETAQKSAEEAKVAAEKVAQEAMDKAVAAAVAQAAAEEALANGDKDAAEKVAAAEAAQKAAEEAKAAAEQSAKEAADKLEAAEVVQKALEDALAKAESDAAEKIAAAEASQKAADAKAAAAKDSEKDAVEKAAAAEAAQKAAEEALANSEADADEKVAAAEVAQKAAEEAAAKAEADKAAADQAAQDAADAQKNAEAAAEQAEADRIAAEAAKVEAEKKAAEEKAAADKEAADKVMASIDAIGKVKKTDDCRDSIVGARAAYDLLTEEQQKLVTNLDVLESAEKKYDALPQTGYSGLYRQSAAVAALLGITGIALVKKSRKEDEEE